MPAGSQTAQLDPDSGFIDPRKVKGYDRNARTHSPEQIEQLRASFHAFGWTNPLLLDEDDNLIAGHGRVQMALLEKIEAVPFRRVRGLSDEQKRALILADNQLAMNAGWDEELLAEELRRLAADDFDLGVIGFNPEWIDELLAGGGAGESRGSVNLGALAGAFLVPPFSVLNAREGWWQDRKRAWLSLGIQSELGRGDNALGLSLASRISFETRASYDEARALCVSMDGEDEQAIIEAAFKRFGERKGRGKATSFTGQESLTAIQQQKGRRKAIPGHGGATNSVYEGNGIAAKKASVPKGLTFGEAPNYDGANRQITGTSIFDPVLCEVAYRWFCPEGGLVLDPFAGGSVRGIVAGVLGLDYLGVDLREEQVAANEDQAQRILAEAQGTARWEIGDSAVVVPKLQSDLSDGVDFVFSCPPYGDLEQYSDSEADLSNMPEADFDEAYRRIIAASVACLKPDRFACFVVGDYRRSGPGFYANFIAKTTAAFEDAGAGYYNEGILVTAIGSLPIRAGKVFRASRKLGKTHQNWLVFCKGDPLKAVAALGDVNVDDALKRVADDHPVPDFVDELLPK